jgi:predicted urease superfamily metal-dependent hydrolase
VFAEVDEGKSRLDAREVLEAERRAGGKRMSVVHVRVVAQRSGGTRVNGSEEALVTETTNAGGLRMLCVPLPLWHRILPYTLYILGVHPPHAP